jgi:hypothetical protein
VLLLQVKLNRGLDFVQLDDLLVDLKLTPDVLEVPVPRYFIEDRAKVRAAVKQLHKCCCAREQWGQGQGQKLGRSRVHDIEEATASVCKPPNCKRRSCCCSRFGQLVQILLWDMAADVLAVALHTLVLLQSRCLDELGRVHMQNLSRATAM